jgi:hypothetical protein
MHEVRLQRLRVGSVFWLVTTAGLSVGGCSIEPLPPGDQTEPSVSAALSIQEASARTPACDGDDHRRPATTTTLGSTGRIEVAADFIGGVFYAEDTILRATAAPNCVVHIESAAKAFSPAGALVVSSDLVGPDGAPPVSYVVNPDPSNEYFEFPDPLLYNFPDGTKVHVQLAGTPVFPAILDTTLRSPVFGTIGVTVPTPPSTGVLTIPSTAALNIVWAVPAGGGLGHRQHQQVSVRLFVLSPVRWAQLYCTWPLVAGHGAVPAVLLRELRAQLGGAGPLDAAVDLYAGEFREVATAASSYVLFATTPEATSFPRSTSATFE